MDEEEDDDDGDDDNDDGVPRNADVSAVCRSEVFLHGVQVSSVQAENAPTVKDGTIRRPWLARIGEELELELVQPQMAQKPMLRVKWARERCACG